MANRRLFILGAFLLLFPLSAFGQSLQLADSLLKKGKQYDQNGNMEQSEFYYREAYNIYRDFQDTVSWLVAGKEYASAMVFLSKNDQAMKLYKKFLEVDHPANDAYNRGDLYNSMGWSCRRIGQLDKALKYYQKSLPLALESGDRLLIGTVYNNLGRVNSERGNNTEALQFLQKAISFYDDENYRAVALANIGNIYSELSLYDKALEYYNQSLQIRKEAGSVYSLSIIYNLIGSVQRQLGNYDQALISNEKGLEFSKKAGTPIQTAGILNAIGLLYKNLGEYKKALGYYRQSLAIRKETTGPSDIATTTNNLGQLFWAMDQKEKAHAFYQQALALRRQVGDPYDIASSLNTMLRMTVDAQDYERAKGYASELKALGDSTDSYKMLQKASSYLGRIDRNQNKDSSALQHFKKAYNYSRYLPASSQLTPIKDLAKQYHKMGSDSAVAYGQKAIDIIEKHRSNVGALSELKSGYFGKHSDFYKQLASWVLTYGDNIPRAYALVEQAKARSLSDELAKASQNIDEQLPEKARIERSQKRQRIDRLYSQLDQTADAQKRNEIRKKIRSAELDYAAYQNRLHTSHAGLKSFESPEPISLDRAREINDKQTVILEYAVTKDQLIIFLISQTNVQVEQFSLDGSGDQNLVAQLTSWVANFKDAILSNASRSRLRSESNKLYEVLIKPFENELAHYENLIIVPDGALAYLPFEALSQGDQYMIENFRIKYEPSLTSLTLLKEPEPISRKNLLAVAGSQTSQSNGLSSMRDQLSALPSTLIEVDSIASHFQQVSMLKNEQVSEQAFKNLLQENQYQYIHLATHGIIDEDQPGRSGLALSSEGGFSASSKEDGMLRSSEIFGLDINSDLVVLSACNTGLGKVVDGEGMLGMQRSFFYAGTSTVVVSLWNVYDRSTASFMNEFYKALLHSQPNDGWLDNTLRWVGWDTSIPFGQKASAMRQAKLKMIKHPLFNHPIYWAPFIVVGR